MTKKKTGKKKSNKKNGKVYKIDKNTSYEEFQSAREDLKDFLTKRY